MSPTNTDQKPFRILVFGGPTLAIGPDVCSLSPLQGALLGIVYGRDGLGVEREEVLSLLWPEEDPRKTRRRLNQLLYSIKKKTGSEAPFECRGDHVLKAPARSTSDLDVYQAEFQASRLPYCANQLSQGFLRGANGSISNPLSDWIEGRERNLRNTLSRALRAELQARESAGDWEGAWESAEAMVLLEPLDESCFRVLLKAQARAGRAGEVDASLSRFAKRWENALGQGWIPSQETKSLLDRIQRGGEKANPRNPLGDKPPQKEAPLVGRDSERALFRRTLTNPPHRAFRGILVTGEAGIGKTRIIRESVFGLDLEGQAVFTADQAELEQMIPLNPLIEALKGSPVGDTLALLDDPWRAVMYGVMPSHFRGEGPIPQAPQIQPGSVPRRLFEACHQLLLALVEEAPVILVIENLQWADDTTLSVLEFLFRRWDRGQLQVVFSLRSEEIRRSSALRSFLDALRVHEDFLEIPLGELSDSASKTLITETSGKPLREEEQRHLHSLAGGNPFFLIELTLEYLAGRVDRPSVPEELFSIPLSIRQVLERRLSQLSEPAEKALGALAVYAKSLRVQALAGVAGLTVSECIAGLDQLHGFRLARNDGVDLSVGHELIRQTVYQSLAAPRRAWLHEQVARHLQESATNPPPDELAIHFHFAGAEDEALSFSREAAERAEASGAIPEALRFLGIAREHTNEPTAVARILGRMGHLNYLHQNLEEAAPLLEVAAQRLRRQGLDPEALRAELERVDSLGQTGLLPFRECLEELERIKLEARESESWETFMKALDVQAHIKELSDDLEGVRGVLNQAAKYANSGGPEAHCQAQALLALNIYFGSAEAGLNAARRAVTVAKGTKNEDLLLHALNRLIIALHYQGLLNQQEGVDTLREAEKRLGTCGDLILKFFIRLNSAVWLLETGELERAESAFRAVETVIRGTKATKPMAMLNINLGELHLEAFDIPYARDRYHTAESYLTPTSPRFFRTIVNAGLGLCALYEGDLHEARSREADLDPDPTFWTFDPVLVTVFRARMMMHRGNLVAAIKHVVAVKDSMRQRFVSAWLRLLLEEGRLRRKLPGTLREEAAILEGLDLSSLLGLTRLHQELAKVVGPGIEPRG